VYVSLNVDLVGADPSCVAQLEHGARLAMLGMLLRAVGLVGLGIAAAARLGLMWWMAAAWLAASLAASWWRWWMLGEPRAGESLGTQARGRE